MRFFEDIEVGSRRELGSFTFTAGLIKKFAAQFDPQRFHLDEEAGRNSLFGGLAASGWHVGSVCMKLLVEDGQREAEEQAARGEKVATLGPSPGFRDLRWIKPVLAGDVISFASEIASRRSSSRGPNGAFWRPVTPEPTSAVNWCSPCLRPPLCHGETAPPEAASSLVEAIVEVFLTSVTGRGSPPA